MKFWRICAVFGCCLGLGGCLLPAGVSVALWAADGVSYLTTEKSLTDHGLSAVSGRDCAMWRILKGDAICKAPQDDGTTAVAEAKPADGKTGEGAVDATAPTTVADVTTPPIGADGLSAIAPAAGPAPSAPPPSEVAATDSFSARLDRVRAESAAVLAEPIAPVGVEVAAAPPVHPVAVAADTRPPKAVTPPPAPARVAALIEAAPSKPRADLYLVVASFRERGMAQRLAKRKIAVDPVVIAASAKGHAVYRVVVGPFERASLADGRAVLARAGLRKSWAIRIAAEAVAEARGRMPSTAPTEVASVR